MAKRRVLKDVRARVPQLVDRQAGRLRWDFAQRLQETRHTVSRELADLVDATVESLRFGVGRVMERQTLSALQAGRILEDAASARHELDRISSELHAVIAAVDEHTAFNASSGGPSSVVSPTEGC
jgi:hypothetical protein